MQVLEQLSHDLAVSVLQSTTASLDKQLNHLPQYMHALCVEAAFPQLLTHDTLSIDYDALSVANSFTVFQTVCSTQGPLRALHITSHSQTLQFCPPLHDICMQAMHITLELNLRGGLQHIGDRISEFAGNTALTHLELTAVPPDGCMETEDDNGDECDIPSDCEVLFAKFFGLVSLKHMPSMSVSFAQLGSFDRLQMSVTLAQLTHLTSLYLRCCMLDIHSVDSLALVFQKLPDLRQLHVEYATDPGLFGEPWENPCERLFAGVQHLTALTLGGYACWPSGIGAVLGDVTGLHCCDLFGVSLEPEHAPALAEALRHMRDLQHLSLRFSLESSANGSEALLPVLDALTVAGTLSSCTKLGLVGFHSTTEMCEQIRRLPGLKHVEVHADSGYSTDYRMLKHLAPCLVEATHLLLHGFVNTVWMERVLSGLTQLRHLEMDAQNCGTVLSTALARLCQLSTLKLTFPHPAMPMEQAYRVRLGSTVTRSFTGLRTLSLDNIHWGADAVELLPLCFLHLRQLQSFSFNWNSADRCIKDLSGSSLASVTCLQDLECLELSLLADSGIRAMADALGSLHKLQSLSLSTTAGCETVRRLEQPVSRCNNLTAVHLCLDVKISPHTNEDDKAVMNMLKGLPQLQQWTIESFNRSASSDRELIVLKAGENV